MTHSQIDAKALQAAVKAFRADAPNDWPSSIEAAISAYLSTLHGQQSEAVAWAAVKDGEINWNYGFWRELPAIVWNEGEGAIPLYTHPLPTEAVAPVAVSVKPLPWEEYNPFIFAADIYRIEDNGANWTGGDRYWLFTYKGRLGNFPTLEAAKAAAQADFEARILSAIELPR